MHALVLILAFIFYPQSALSKTVPKIALIGGGIGGTSCAYFLQQLYQGRAPLTLYEKGAVGGRLSLIDIDDRKYEAGGSILHPRNQYMVQFSKLLGLGLRQTQSSKLGIYNGEKFVFEENDWYFLTIANLMWHYGLSVFHLFKDVRSMLNDFSRIYTLQENAYAYTSVDLLLSAMNPTFVNMTQTSLYEILTEKGYSQKFLDELVQSVMMVNYGQTNNISGFAGYVSLAGAESNLWSVEGGNKLIPEGLLKFTNADFKEAAVTEVELLPNKRYAVRYGASSPDKPLNTDYFDIVVICAPLMKNAKSIKFINFKQDLHHYERPFHQTVSTFVKGTLNPSAFNKESSSSLPDEILTNKNSLVFNSIAKSFPVEDDAKEEEGGEKAEVKDEVKKVDTTSGVYKVFSQTPLSQETVQKFFRNVDAVKEKVWLAYPQYRPPEKLSRFILHPGLYYLNAIEVSASAMEMSAIAAKNIALLIFNFWKDALDKIDAEDIVIKDEL